MPLEQKLIDSVTNSGTVIDGAITFISGLSEQLRNMGGSKEEEDALADQLDAKAAALGAALVANTAAATEKAKR